MADRSDGPQKPLPEQDGRLYGGFGPAHIPDLAPAEVPQDSPPATVEAGPAVQPRSEPGRTS